MTYSGGGVNVDVLLAGLKEYRKSLEVHLAKMTSEHNQLEQRWRAFNSVAAGNYADEFRSGWIKTDEQFKAYISQSQKIKSFLNDRISHLENM